MNKFFRNILTATALSIVALSSVDSMACTSAIIGAELNPYGRPILWKHRDTSNIDNKVEYVAGNNGSYGYVALFNADDKALKEAWMGMNEKGFAIMNTASYNLKDDKVSAKKMDKEGILMTAALKACASVDEFEAFLTRYPRPMGVEANFGVIDALGNGAYFETNNHSFKRFDLKDAPEHILIRTNYSHSGRKDEGLGYIREDAANTLLAPYVEQKEITAELLTEEISRSFWHDLIKHDFASGGDRWAVDQDLIPRFKSTATVAIEGCLPQNDLAGVNADFVKNQYVMWTGLGYPPCSEIRAVTCSDNGVPQEVRGSLTNGHAPLADKAKDMRNAAYPIKRGSGEKYIDINALFNEHGTGIVQEMKRKNKEYYRAERSRRGYIKK